MLVYVINMNGVPLMPTIRNGLVRKLLRQKKAKVIKRDPFIIQLLYDTPDVVQDVEFKEDTGYLNIGASSCSDKAEIYSAEVELNPNIKNNLQDRRKYRRTRRNKLRYRARRIDNRRRPEGWLPPSIQHKVDTHVNIADKASKFIPISKISVEVANFDTQAIKNPEISGKEYQEGDLCDFRNLREYVFFRDNYTCQICGKNAFEDGIELHMHHVEYWKGNRANTPSNTLTACTKCHCSKNHQKTGVLWGREATFKSLRPETYMATVRKIVVSALRARFPDIEVVPTYGYLTKDKRITLGIEKSHANDAYCIGDKQPPARLAETIYYKQKSKNNRSLEKFYDAKYIDSRDGTKKTGKELFSGRSTRNKNLNSENLHKYRNQKVSKGKRTIRKNHYPVQPNDIVMWKNRLWTSKGTHNNGTRVLIEGHGLKKARSVAIKDLVVKTTSKTIYRKD